MKPEPSPSEGRNVKERTYKYTEIVRLFIIPYDGIRENRSILPIAGAYMYEKERERAS